MKYKQPIQPREQIEYSAKKVHVSINYLEELYKFPQNRWFIAGSSERSHIILNMLYEEGLIARKSKPVFSHGIFRKMSHQYYYNKNLKYGRV